MCDELIWSANCAYAGSSEIDGVPRKPVLMSGRSARTARMLSALKLCTTSLLRTCAGPSQPSLLRTLRVSRSMPG